ncbi:phosphotransferase enzyme family protein [Pseudalkalibacillus caeni]|uniref:Protein kinase domain-containing protein n=1 Tax=Exobacillus caeni TaxID=2574798 RepID=A0A5R9F2R2_9BACL|nr:phosphotransferase [Pseudalkalibacillus caeni]TLS37962.1 hypothetical protein FCL54_09095 [Pseudalkalibacillus caeni]
MEQAVEKLFSEELLHKACALFNTGTEETKKHGDFENYVFEVYRDKKPYILRLTHSSHRKENDVLAELQWINFLKEQNCRVIEAYPSVNGKLTEVLEAEDTYFIACLFEKAPGKMIDFKEKSSWNSTLFKKWGETIGRMHRATTGYEASEDARRPSWIEDDLIDIEKYVSEAPIIEKNKELVQYISSLPERNDSYGLMHTDVHPGNFFVDDTGEITVFDFDDSAYNYFASDIAIALYYSLWWAPDTDGEASRIAFAEKFMDAFMEGYQKEFDLGGFWIEQIPHFLRMRDFALYAVFHKKMDLENINENLKKFLEKLKYRLENDIPVVDVDFSRWVTSKSE